MKSNYARCLEIVLGHEGGYSDHPADPGGATMRGVTQRTYDSYRIGKGLSPQPVRNIAEGELQAIYRTGYWDVVRGDELPAGVDLAVFDYAVNSGPGRAAKEMQRVVLTTMDGVIGPQTIAAVKARAPATIITPLCAGRLAFLEGLSTWPTFKNGWQRRVRGIEAEALRMVDAPVAPTPAPLPPSRTSSTVPSAGLPAWLWAIAALAIAAGIAFAIFH